MTYDTLTAKLKQIHDENPEAKVFVRGDADTVHFNIIRVLDILRSVGFYKVAFEIKSEAHGPHWVAWLTGAATLFSVQTLWNVVMARAAGLLPGGGSYVYNNDSVDPDGELTLALVHLGYKVIAAP
jgi:hypothetical protein